MMKRNAAIALTILLTFILQTSFLQIFPSILAKPNLLLILTVSMGFMRGRKNGLWIGFTSGILIDLFYGNLFGLTALLFMYVGYFNGFLYKVFFDRDIKAPMILVGISDLLYNLIYYIIEFAMRERFDFSAYLRYTILPEVIITVLFTILFYKLYYLINKKIAVWELEEQQSPWLRK